MCKLSSVLLIVICVYLYTCDDIKKVCLQDNVSLSLPGSPFLGGRRTSKSPGGFIWPNKKRPSRAGDKEPLVFNKLEEIAKRVPFMDDSSCAASPTSEDLLCIPSNNTQIYLSTRRRLSSASCHSRSSHHSFYLPSSRRSSVSSFYSRRSPGAYPAMGGHSHSFRYRHPRDSSEPTHFPWNPPRKRKDSHPLLPAVVVDKTKSDDNVSAQGRGHGVRSTGRANFSHFV